MPQPSGPRDGSRPVSPHEPSPGSHDVPGPTSRAAGENRESRLLVGNSQHIRDVYRQINLLAPWRRGVVVTGESGTGKSLVAEELHRRSGRRGQFVRVSASELLPDFVQPLLAGHTADAYTGAMRERSGLLVQASGGTLCLDDIQDLLLASQSYLLDAIEGKPLRPKGGGREFIPDVRWVFLTQVPLGDLVAGGGLKPDLAARMGQIEIRLHPLRERQSDVAQLVPQLLARTAVVEGLAPIVVSNEALAALSAHDWPANIRDLDDALWQSWIVSRDQGAECIEIGHLPERVCQPRTRQPRRGRPRGADDKTISRLLSAKGSHKRIAETLGVSARTIRRRLAEAGAPGGDAGPPET